MFGQRRQISLPIKKPPPNLGRRLTRQGRDILIPEL
jgi:hypothetical protein